MHVYLYPHPCSFSKKEERERKKCHFESEHGNTSQIPCANVFMWRKLCFCSRCIDISSVNVSNMLGFRKPSRIKVLHVCNQNGVCYMAAMDYSILAPDFKCLVRCGCALLREAGCSTLFQTGTANFFCCHSV